MSRLAIIPARGGSKRIPRKNIRPFLERPILAYSIEAALGSKLFDQVIISTEDEEIAEVGKRYGASVPFLRSAANATDFASTLDVLREVHDRLGMVETACCIYATAPFVTADLLKRGLDILEGGRDAVFPVLPFPAPIQRALRMDDGGRIAMFVPENLNRRSQDLEPAYHDSGMFYWYRPEVVLAAGTLWPENSGAIVLQPMQAHDIDTPEDWTVAEFKYKLGNHAR